MTDTNSPDAGRAYWERHASRYDASFKALDRPFARMLERTAEAVRGAPQVLEVAAGTGLVSAVLAPQVAELVATDYAENMVVLLAQRMRDRGLDNVRCERADIYALRFAPASFDAVVAANVLHLTPDLPGALAALRRVLKPGGRLIAPTFCHDQTALSWIVSRLLAITGFPGRRRFTVSTLCVSLRAAGLEITHSELIPGIIPIGYVEGTFA
jgi:phosphatidylethanolamine/phosphatidyl-N-methylethanolamine N-methyltransferase